MTPIPDSMRAVRNTTHGGPSALTVDTIDVPSLTPSEALIRVHAAGITYPDVLQTRGAYQLRIPLPFTIGCELAGEVVAAGPDAGVSVGDRVAAIAPSGAFAEYAAVDGARVLPLPDNLDFATAAGMPMNVLTADFALSHRGRLRSEETVLIQGAAGGLGVALIQRAKIIGARVIAVVSTPQKAEVARAAGAHEAILVDGFLDAVRSSTAGRGVDMVVDPVGGDRFTDSLRALATDGRLLVLGFAAGEIPTVKVNRLLLNNIAVIGVAWGGLMATGAISPRQQWEQLLPAIAARELDPIIGTIESFEDTPLAVAALDERRAHGKTIIRVRPEEESRGSASVRRHAATERDRNTFR
ncbi:NADPH:quinone oxidoreductase family protein [Microbacterium sp. RD1]|uniref:NADPH:quinone oxidoreductase family protein n=1 Tax=Microbacterium sp. RD1 TaxID=3457313 RepID=UPI003FA564AA